MLPIHPMCRFPQDNNPYALVDPQNLPCQPVSIIEYINHTTTELHRGFSNLTKRVDDFTLKLDRILETIRPSTTPPPNYHYYPSGTNDIDYVVLAAGIAIYVLIPFAAAYLIRRKFFPATPITDQSHRTTPLTPDQAMKKMRKNAEKATTEAIPSRELLEQKEHIPLQLKHAFTENLESHDKHFFTETPQGTLIGVFSGHRGKEVSNYANQEFQNRFSDTLQAHNGNVFQSFEDLIHEIHKEVAQKPEWNSQGSTLVISFIDKETHQIITATMGTNEANIYRGEKSIPLSLIRDWTSRKDEERLKKAYGKAADRPIWKNQSIPKTLCSRLDKGVIISRAIGLIDETGTKEKPLVIHKPKITINKLQKGDILVLGSSDSLREMEIVKTIAERAAWTIRNVATWIFNWIITTIFCRPTRGLAHNLVHQAKNALVAVEVS